MMDTYTKEIFIKRIYVTGFERFWQVLHFNRHFILKIVSLTKNMFANNVIIMKVVHWDK